MNKCLLRWIFPLILMFFVILEVKAGCGSGYSSNNPTTSFNKCTGALSVSSIKFYERNSGDPDDILDYQFVYLYINGSWQLVWQMVRDNSFAGAASHSREERTFYYGVVGSSGISVSNNITSADIANWWYFNNLTITNLPQSILDAGQVKVWVSGRMLSGCNGYPAYPTYENNWTLDLQDITAPMGLTATQTNCNSVNLSWQNGTQIWESNTGGCSVTGTYDIQVLRNGSQIAVLPANTTTYADNTAQINFTYNYTIKTRYRASSGNNYIYSNASNIGEGKLRDGPAQVSGFNVSKNNCNGSIRLDWQWNQTNPSSFKIQRSSSLNGTYVTIANLSGSIRNYTNDATTPAGNTVTKGLVYYYKISAIDGCSREGELATENGIAPDVPTAPTVTSVTVNNTTNTITVNWNDNSNNETRFSVIRNTIGVGGSATFEVDANTTTYIDNTAAACVNYQYLVKAHNDCSVNGISSTGNFTGYLQPNLTSTFTTSKLLKASKGYYSDRIVLEWQNNNSAQITSFRIYRKQAASQSDSTLIGTVSSGSGIYIDANALANIVYKYTIIGETQCAGNSIFTNSSSDIGFRSPFGLISGKVSYAGGTAVKDVKVSATSTASASGSSLLFTGNSSASSTVTSSEIDLSTGFTVECWARPINLAAGERKLIELKNATNNVISLYHNNSRIYFKITNASLATKVINTDTGVFNASEYSQITCTMKSDSMYLYVNGIKRTALSLSGFSFLPMNDCRMELGSLYQGNLDEIRVWTTYKNAVTVGKDFGRFVSPDEEGLVGYWNLDENIPGLFNFFDQSKTGTAFNETHGNLNTSVQWSSIIPGNNLLTNASYTDANGDYLITNVRYSGTGQTYTITPNLSTSGVAHRFTPSTSVVFIGEGATVINSTNFTDNSSFVVTGRVIFAKGTGCPSKDVFLKIDGNTATKFGSIVKTAADGTFELEVPIGPHVITVEKAGHTFSVGRFPQTGSYEFIGPLANVTFRDTTLVKVVGRVVGGLRELKKVANLGRSKNNIGVAKIVFRSSASGANGCVEDTIITNSLTGEYVAYLPPMFYTIPTLTIPSDLTKVLTDIKYGNANTLDISVMPVLINISDTLRIDTLTRIDTTSYHTRLDFKYVSEPQIFVTKSTTPRGAALNNFIGESYLNIFDNNVPMDNSPFGYPVFIQNKVYEANINIIENYYNRDGGLNIKDSVPVSGSLSIFNNSLAVPEEFAKLNIPVDNGYFEYSFRAGAPNQLVNTTSPQYSYTSKLEISFTPTVGARVVWAPNTSDNTEQQFRGYVFGARSGGSNFTTTGPALVDLILRDPPGSASYTSWQKGTAFTTTESWSVVNGEEIGVEAKVLTGSKLAIVSGFGVAVATETEIVNSVGPGVNQSFSVNNNGELVTTTTINTTISTSDDPANVGAGSDLFFGKATNMIFGISDNLKLMDTATCRIRKAKNNNKDECYGNAVNGHQIGLSQGFFMVPGEVQTKFVYTAKEIEESVIPSLVDLRNQFLNKGHLNKRGLRKYSPVFNNTSDEKYMLKFGSNNDDPIWGSLRSSSTVATGEAKDTIGQSYIFRADSLYEVDSIRYFNNQIRLWKNALARNEREKYEIFKDTSILAAAGGQNVSIGEASFQQDITSQVDDTKSEEIEWQLNPFIATEFTAKIAGVGVQFNGSITYNHTEGKISGTTNTTTNTLTYFLKDGDAGDLISVDMVDAKKGDGRIFRLRAGRTSCPYEDAVYAKYFDPDNDTVTATTVVENGVELSKATAKREVPKIDVSPAQLFNVPAKDAAVFTLQLGNLSESRQDMTYDLRVNEATNPYGAIIKVDGLDPNRSFNVPYGATSQKTLTVERGPNNYDFENIQLILRSTCQEDIFDTFSISVKFLPTCTSVEMLTPTDRWVLNNSFKDTFPTAIGSYNYNFGGFNNVKYQYKPAASSQWLTLQNFYKDTSTATGPGVKIPIPIGQPYINYNWITNVVPDGNYEIRAVTECIAPGYPNTFIYSPTLQGVIDRVNPSPFGTPSPGDGILDPNDDISIQFNEPIDNSSLTLSNFDIRGVLNGSNLQTNTSLLFDGQNDFIELPTGVNLINKPFTIEIQAKRGTLGTEQCLVSQGVDANQNIWFGFDVNNKLVFRIGNETVMSNLAQVNTLTFSNYSVSFSPTEKKAFLYVNGILANTGSTSMFSTYLGAGKMFVGKSSFGNERGYIGSLLELRIWSVARTAAQIQANLTKTLTGREVGILGNWRIDEAEGTAVKDIIRARHGNIFGAVWQITPVGKSYTFNGTNARVVATTSNMSITKEMDFTLEFWVKSNQAGAATLFSNGKGDSTDGTLNIAWSIQKTTNGALIVKHGNSIFSVIDSGLFDNNWHHVALVMQRNSSFSSYLDGNLQKTFLTNNFSEFSGPRLSLGARTWINGTVVNYDSYFNGQLDEVRFWNIAKSQELVKRDKVNRLLGNEPGLTLYIPFELYSLDPTGVPVLTASINDVADNSHISTASGSGAFSSETPTIKLPRPVQSIAFTYSVNNDKIILTPTTESQYIENVTLDITVKDIFDLRGNKMQSPKTWIAYMNKNQVKWQDKELSFQKQSLANLTFKSNIINSGGALKTFNLENIPQWLTASPSSGTVSPNNIKEITFTVNPNVNIGSYEEAVGLITDFGFTEKLVIKLKVSAPEPSWNVDAGKYQNSMSIIGMLKIGNVISTNPDNILAAFMNGECRGKAKLQYFENVDRYLVFLDIMGDSIAPLTFKVWNAAEGKMHDDVTPEMQFVPNDLRGSINVPIIFNADDKLSRIIPLNNGWNWISFNLNMKDSNNFNKLLNHLKLDGGEMIKSQTQTSDYNIGQGWLGSLSSPFAGVKPQYSYRLKSVGADTLTISGVEIDPSNIPVPLVTGWNWIGFVSQRNMSTNEALANFTANHGDVIKSQNSFAMYDSILGWVGSLQALRPNLGYMYSAKSNGVIYYPRSGMFGKKTAEPDFVSKKYNTQYADYQNNMNMVVKLNVCTNLQASGELLLGAYVNNTLRGLAKAQLVNNELIYYITIAGENEAEKISFKILNEYSNNSFDCNESVAFMANNILGKTASPLLLSTNAKISCESNLSVMVSALKAVLYPNPTRETQQVKLAVDMPTDDALSITVFDINGREIAYYKTAQLNKGYQILPLFNTSVELAQGIYFVRLSSSTQNIHIKFLKQ